LSTTPHPTNARQNFHRFLELSALLDEHHLRKGAQEVVRIPWKPTLYATLVSRIDPAAVYAGTHVYASYDPNNRADKPLRRFLHAMDGFPGYDVLVKERKPQGPIRCPECRQAITVCPHCAETIQRTVEKGVDTALATDLIRFGIDGHYDRAVLIAADADHVPAVEFLGQRMKQVTHAWFRGHAHELRNACWDHLLFDDLMNDLLPAAPPG
jgi:uncharacterized LabA/DUF88 family protein